MELEIKNRVGRPTEDNIVRQDLTGYKISAKFRRKVVEFFNFWDKAVLAKAKGKKSYVRNMEEFFGELIDKFEELGMGKQVEVLHSEAPFKMIKESTNLRFPEVFPTKKDNDEFIEVVLTHKF